VAKVAEMVAQSFAPEKVDLIEVKKVGPEEVARYDNLILGFSTIGKANWDSEHHEDDWDLFLTRVEKINWDQKKVALFSLGDQVMYPNHFVDALGWVYDRLAPTKAQMVGFCQGEDYRFNESAGFREGVFLGLPVDEDSEPEKTSQRVKAWVSGLRQAFKEK
jgi:flavodoxin I